VTSAKIAPGQVGTTQLADSSVTSAKIAPGQVGTTQLASNAVTTAQLANNAVTTAQLADNSVTAGKIASGQVLKTLNGFTDFVTLQTDANLQLTTEAVLGPTANGGIFTISAPNMLTQVAHDASLSGNGTSASPLSVASGAAAPTQTPVAFNTQFVVTDGQTGCAPGSGTVGTSNVCAATYVVPQGKRLVIQQVAVYIEDQSSAQLAQAFLVIDGDVINHSLPIVLTKQAPIGLVTGFAGSQQVTIYLNAGETVDVGGARNGSHGKAIFTFLFYGYLLDAQ
jgi:hypothetical protein